MGYRGTKESWYGPRDAPMGLTKLSLGPAQGFVVSYRWAKFVNVTKSCKVLIVYAFHQSQTQSTPGDQTERKCYFYWKNCKDTFENFRKTLFWKIGNFHRFNVSAERFKTDNFFQTLQYLVLLDKIILIVI